MSGIGNQQGQAAGLDITVPTDFFGNAYGVEHKSSEITPEESDALEIIRGGLVSHGHHDDVTNDGESVVLPSSSQVHNGDDSLELELPINTTHLTELIFDTFFEIDLDEEAPLMRDTVSALIYHIIGEKVLEVVGCFGKLLKRKVVEKKALELLQKTDLLPKEKIPQSVLDEASNWYKETLSRLHQTRSGSRLYHFIRIKHYTGEHECPPGIRQLSEMLGKQPDEMISSEDQLPIMLKKLKKCRDDYIAARQANKLKRV
jgi:hypothetical protein